MTLGLFDPAFLGGLAAGGGGYDADAQDFINRVIAADVAAGNTSGLEVGVQDAINTFFVGCKADGTFSALKASCILAGARTRAGALVPLLSSMPAPTSVNFVDADYNRKTGLKGNGSTKYLNSGRNNNADPQNSNHNAVYVSEAQTASVGQYIGSGGGDPGRNNLGHNPLAPESFARSRSSDAAVIPGTALGFTGHDRSNSANFILRGNGSNTTVTAASATPENASIDVFRRGTAGYCNGRLSFYSIGESLNLALLDARVTTLMSALAAAIP